MNDRRPASADSAADTITALHARVQELEVELAALREDHAALIELREDYLAATHNLGASEEEIRVQQEELERAAQNSELLQLRYRDLFEHSPVGILMVSESGFVDEANRAVTTILGSPQRKLSGRPLATAFPTAQRKQVREFLRRIFQTTEGPPAEEILELHDLGPDGDRSYLLRGYADPRLAFPERRARISVADVTSLRLANVQTQLLETVFDSMHEALTITDADNRIVRINSAFSEITGYSADDIVGKTPSILQSGRQTRAFYQEMWESIQRSGWWSGEIWNRRKGGEIFPEWLTISTLRDDDNRVTGYVGIFSDISIRKRSENDLIRLAHFDPLTNLPNRTLLFDRLRNALAIGRRHKSGVALLFIDLDRFKGVNDAYGHREGDALLADAAQRIVSCLRETDTVARIGGDEFVVVLTFVTGEVEATEVGRKIIAALGQTFHIGRNVHHIGASVGLAMFPDDGDDEETLLRHADASMYGAKVAGRNKVRHLSRPERERLEYEATLERQMHGALEHGEYFLVYQPQMLARTRRLAGFEALVRWRRPDGSIVSPADFIPIAERTGFIAELDRHVIELGVRQLRQWVRDGLRLPPFSFNLSPHEFQREGIELEVLRQIRSKGLVPDLIGIEVTESSAMADLQKTIKVLEGWRRIGIKVAIDDFGTGHSSLAYLRHFPASCLKIDQAFVRGIGRSVEEAALVESMLSIARSLNLAVVAEGVETAEQYEFLRDRGCELIQGYYFSRPLEAAAAADFILADAAMKDAG